jgi:hypothetical protein
MMDLASVDAFGGVHFYDRLLNGEWIVIQGTVLTSPCVIIINSGNHLWGRRDYKYTQ